MMLKRLFPLLLLAACAPAQQPDVSAEVVEAPVVMVEEVVENACTTGDGIGGTGCPPLE